MAQYAKLEIIKREQPGSQAARAIRKEGKIPVNFYYTGKDNINLAIDKKVFREAIHSGHHIFEVELNEKTQYVMIKEVQYHPVSDEIIHIDLMRVRRDEKINIFVPIILEGTAQGVKEGGILTQNLTTIEISCLPADVPEHIVVDVTDFEMNHVMNVGEVQVGDNIEVITAKDMDVLAVIPPREESLEPEIPTEEELAEAEAVEEEVAEGEPAREAVAEETTEVEGKE
ncbi:MAG: 50S ribosomal protein L25 [Candidatus Marinimicrobia bacterium]|jgi:large subunit ribosomal protein L25|nr:50S ribosomal protein L25 [Candidatus Neomarinimicrobiota bacterium]